MPLDEYRRKRDFTKSPEPAGDARTRGSSGPAFFCVQKHLASHLHYDFRLEHEGVLLSWAVPKGPALDPAIKRLAMHVEDHPIEYGSFEGVIPDGYGAGIVMLWDQGTWEPEVADVGAALRKGDLKFRLNGLKLKGSWVLVRTKGGDGRSWLLIKHRDEWSGPLDIAEFAPLSVKSGGDFADILAGGTPEIWRSHRPAQGGDTGRMFERIVERALALRAERDGSSLGAPSDRPRPAGRTPARRSTAPKPTRGKVAAGRIAAGTKAASGTRAVAPRKTRRRETAATKSRPSAKKR